MVNGSTNTALRQVARVFREGTLTGLSDGQMLERFVDRRDEAAFEVLVVRHGPMVFNVCRQLLRDPHDVEDAFQAVFLALVRKAGLIRVEGSLGPWLHTVANRIAARARANRRRIARLEVIVNAEPIGPPTVRTLLDARPTVRVSPGEPSKSAPNTHGEAASRPGSTSPRPLQPQGVQPTAPSRERIQQLLDDLQQEIQKLPLKVDGRSAPVQ